MEFTYTSGWDEFENYCGKLFRGYLKRYCQGKEYKDEIKQAYVTEMSFIQKKVNENKEILKQLWVAAFVGNLSRKNDLTVTVRTHSCTLILSLFIAVLFVIHMCWNSLDCLRMMIFMKVTWNRLLLHIYKSFYWN